MAGLSGLATSETTSIPVITSHKKLNILEVGINLGIKMMRQAHSNFVIRRKCSWLYSLVTLNAPPYQRARFVFAKKILNSGLLNVYFNWNDHDCCFEKNRLVETTRPSALLKMSMAVNLCLRWVSSLSSSSSLSWSS